MRRSARIWLATGAAVLAFASTELLLELIFGVDRDTSLGIGGAAMAAVGISLGVWVNGGVSAGGRPRIRRGVWAMEAPAADDIARPDVTDDLVRLLSMADGESVGITTALVGAGGFGKTSLARQLCAHPLVRRRYGAGVWLTIGERPAGSELAAMINDVYYRLTGERPSILNPDLAGDNLGELLDGRDRVLLVLDDVWRDEQLRPFRRGGRHATRLVTTRRPGLLAGAAKTVKVDELSEAQAIELLTAGRPAPAGEGLTELLRLTGRWPLLVRLANGYLGDAIASGVALKHAVDMLNRRLADDGPDAIDLNDEVSRDRAAAASINASLDLLAPTASRPVDGRALFLRTGAFAEDTDIGSDMLRIFWGSTGGLSDGQVDQLCDRMYGLSLVAQYIPGRSVRLHDVVRSFLRTRSAVTLRSFHNELLDASRPLTGDPGEPDGVTAWWNLPDEPDYLWSNLCWHLGEAGRRGERIALLRDLRWAYARIRRNGPAALEADLAEERADPVVAALARAVRAYSADFATAARQEPLVLAELLFARLRGFPGLNDAARKYLAHLPESVRMKNGSGSSGDDLDEQYDLDYQDRLWRENW
jgi:hypothetical protein